MAVRDDDGKYMGPRVPDNSMAQCSRIQGARVGKGKRAGIFREECVEIPSTPLLPAPLCSAWAIVVVISIVIIIWHRHHPHQVRSEQ